MTSAAPRVLHRLLLPSLFAALAGLVPAPARAATLAQYAHDHTLKLFVPAKDAVMPNTTDQTNNFKDGDRALLLSSAGLTDLTGISTLTVEDGGKPVPITSVKRLHLFLNRNQITAIPDEFAALKNVRFIYLEYNRLSELPRTLMEMDSLEGMYFTANRFTEIPPFVFDMTRLRKLQFSKNQLTALPPELGNLTHLIHFNMSSNKIAAVPESISRLTALRVCDLSDNRITSLPESFGRVRILYQLRVRNNPMTTLPAGFAGMPATIDITGTKIDPATLPPELAARINTEKPTKAVSADTLHIKRPAKPKKKP